MSPKLVVSSQFDFDRVDFSKESDVNLDVSLTAPEQEGQKRIPLHIILAIDVSGSMSGNKLDSVKSTANKLLDHVTENDTVGVIAFSEAAFDVVQPLPMTTSNRDAARTAIRNLHTLGSTNIEAALISALEKASTAGKDQVSRIVLLSDGRPNVGNSTPERLIGIPAQMTKSVSLSTFGYGNDYDPELLASMSSAGRGNHFYIQNDGDCRNAFALELGGLLSLYAQDIKVTLTMSGTVAVDEFLSGYDVTQSAGYRGITGGKLTFTVPDIFAGEKKHALLRLKVPSASEAVCARQTKVCDITVDYLDVESKARAEVTGVVKIQYTKPGKVATAPNKEVHDQLFMIEAAKKQAEAKKKIETGDITGARILLQEAQVWSSGSSAENAGLVASNFSNLLSNTNSMQDYRLSGSKMFTAYSTSYVTARSASSDTMGLSFMSKRQKNVVADFGTNNAIGSAMTTAAPGLDNATSSSVLNSGSGSTITTTGTVPKKSKKNKKQA